MPNKQALTSLESVPRGCLTAPRSRRAHTSTVNRQPRVHFLSSHCCLMKHHTPSQMIQQSSRSKPWCSRSSRPAPFQVIQACPFPGLGQRWEQAFAALDLQEAMAESSLSVSRRAGKKPFPTDGLMGREALNRHSRLNGVHSAAFHENQVKHRPAHTKLAVLQLLRKHVPLAHKIFPKQLPGASILCSEPGESLHSHSM